jgi:hypothetical protein
LGLLALVVLLGMGRTARATPSAQDLTGVLERLSKDEANRAIVKDAAARARDALDRSRQMERAGDTRHAALLRETAAEWVALATDLVRTAAAERDAQAAEKALVEAETKTVRARALLEETISRKGRAEAQWAELTRNAAAAKAAPPPPKRTPAKAPAKK